MSVDYHERQAISVEKNHQITWQRVMRARWRVQVALQVQVCIDLTDLSAQYP
jgi:hypothetical protein